MKHIKPFGKLFENHERDYDEIARMLKDNGWGDIIDTERPEEFENSDYYLNNMTDEEYADAMDDWLNDIQNGTIEEDEEIEEEKDRGITIINSETGEIKKFENYEFDDIYEYDFDEIEKGDTDDEWIESVGIYWNTKNFEKAKIVLNNIKKNDKIDELIHYVIHVLQDGKLEQWIQENL